MRLGHSWIYNFRRRNRKAMANLVVGGIGLYKNP